jgi:DNA-binding NarL/FixJ family response regulator
VLVYVDGDLLVIKIPLKPLLKQRKMDPRGVELRRRGAQVLPMVVRGLTNKEIANELNISERTAKFHVKDLMLKFGVKDRYTLASIAEAGTE